MNNPLASQDVDEFVSSSDQVLRNLALHHLLTNGSTAVNGCRQNEWMGAVRMRVQIADKNITIIHMTPVFWIKYKFLLNRILTDWSLMDYLD